MYFQQNRAFTLIELSIVLVIIGLIVGGVLVGQDLIKAAQMRKNISLIESYNTAVMTFKLKYNAIPGDMTNATQFWGTKSDCTNSGSTVRTTDGTTCNGNGNRLVSNTTNANLEAYCFWQHLSNAKLIAGSYPCSAGSLADSEFYKPGVDFPSTVGRDGYWTILVVNSTNYFEAYRYYADAFQVDAPVFTPSEAFQMDSKVDDGKPLLGSWQIGVNSNGCRTSSTPSTSVYTTVSTIECTLQIKAAF